MSVKLKYLFVFLTLSIFLISCNSPADTKVNQELLSKFDRDIDAYFGYMNNMEWESMLSMTNPRLFDIVPKETMIDMFKSLYESGMEMNVQETTPTSYSTIVEQNGDHYCKVMYDGVLTMTLSQTLMANIEMFKTELYKSYNQEEVKIVVEKNQIIIDSEKEIIAMSADNQKTWTYFELQEGQDEMLSKLIPQSVLNKINQ